MAKLDRFARSVSQASELITKLIDDGIRVDVCNLGILDNSSMSTLMRNILFSFAQFERDMIVERTQEGKAIARQNPNFKEGRPKKFSKAQIDHAVKLLSDYSDKQVEQMTGISKSTLIRAKRSGFDFYRIINVNFDDYVDKFDKVTYSNITNICKTTTKSMVKEESLWQNRF